MSGRAEYERVAVERFAQARAEAAELEALGRRLPVWEEVAARWARVSAMFAEAGAAAALAGMWSAGGEAG